MSRRNEGLHQAVCMLAFLLLLVSGCGGGADPDPTSGNATETGIESSGPSPVGGIAWPDGIPSDIPVLDGEITNVMAGPLRVRLFYGGVSDATVASYLDTLESAGYELDFVVYETPAGGDRAAERAEAGEWDEVRATKGEYRLGLSYGEGTGVLDIDGISIDGFGPDTSWPERWAGIPPPTALAINEVIDLGMNGPLVEVGYETDADIEAYVDELEAVGFVVTHRAFNQNGQIISVTVANEISEVEMQTYPGGRLNISVSESSGPSTQPVTTREFPEWLPEVPGGEIATASTSPDGGFSASVTIEGDHTVAGYVQVLLEAGYVESGSMLAGYVLSDGERTVTIYGDDGVLSPLQILIQAGP